ncbi:MAG: F0F1 ATP synthase subunit B' [Microcystaceae cyanobacterium]
MFDFDATMPLMALQFVVLAVILNAIFYKPLSKVLDERADYIRQNETEAQEKLTKVKALEQELQQKLADARKASQKVISEAQAEAEAQAAQKISVAQQEAIQKKEQAAQEIEQQKQEALSALEQQVEALSGQILEKILGPELV